MALLFPITNLSLSSGGTGASLTANNGGIVYSTATTLAILAGTATANQVLLSGSSTTPSWSTAVYPATTTINQLLYSSSTNTIAGLATGNNGVLITSAGGVPSISSTLPSAVQGNITSLGTITSGVWTGTSIGLANGGTNAALTASNGGIVYSGSSALAILSANANSGLALVSGGAGAPTWFAPTLGSVIFAKANGALGQDNGKFFWDDTNFRLGIGTASPANVIEVVVNSIGDGVKITGTGSNAPQVGIYNGSTQLGAFGVAFASGNYANFASTNDFVVRATNASSSGNLIFTTQNSTGSIIFGSGSASNNDTAKMQMLNNGNFGIGDSNPATLFSVAAKFQVNSSGVIPKYNNVSTAGWGVPAIYGSGRSTAQTGAVASVATYTVGGSDGSFIVSMNILITAFTAGTISGVITYTDEGNTGRSLTMNFSSIGGTLGTTAGAAGAFEGVPLHIRAKASTAITITTTVSVFTGTYNVEGIITQLA